jgi:hypothetical protein
MAINDWYWACSNDFPALDRFIIENGQDALWPRVRREIDQAERCSWMHIHRHNKGAHIEDILDLMLTVVHPYRINHNRFILEAAKIPVFAKYLRHARADLCNYVSNAVCDDPLQAEPFSRETMNALGRIVSRTLNVDDDWF